MMRATLMISGVAVVALGGALWMRPEPPPVVAFEDTGEPLFAEFVDPSAPASLEVVQWDEKQASVRRFNVEQKEGRWVIPSHHNYPADAVERMGKAAASFIGVKKDIYYGDKPEDHARAGVVEPDDPEAESGHKGKHITLRDASGTALVDIIVGKEIPDKNKFYYVRYPGEKRVYGSRIDLDISVDFADWIEKDLMRIDKDNMVTVVYDPYQVDEKSGRITSRVAGFRFDRQTDGDDKNKWSLTEGGKPPQGQELDSFQVQQMVSAVDNLSIVGVRPSPPELATGRLDLPAVLDLQSKGFFVGRGRLLGNEGELRLIQNDGIVYNLYFGELTFESGLALTAGESPAASESDDNAPKDKPAEGESKQGNRYLLVTVGWDPAFDQRPPPTATPKDEAAKGEAAKGEAAKGERTPPEQLASLKSRFGQWFYVISDQSFKNLHKDPAKLFRKPHG